MLIGLFICVVHKWDWRLFKYFFNITCKGKQSVRRGHNLVDCSKSWGTMVCGLQNDNNIQLLSCAQVDLWLCETYVDLFVTYPHDFLSISILSSPNTEMNVVCHDFHPSWCCSCTSHKFWPGACGEPCFPPSKLHYVIGLPVLHILFLNCLLYGLFMLWYWMQHQEENADVKFWIINDHENLNTCR